MTLKRHGGLLKNQDELTGLQKKKKITAVFPQHTGVGIIACQQGDDVNLRTLKIQPFTSIRNPYLRRAPPSRRHPSTE